MDWINNANQIIVLITGFIGLIGTGVGAFFAIRNWIKVMKQKSAQEIWNTVMALADAAMEDVERLDVYGDDAKHMVIDMVDKACKRMGLDISVFLNQLDLYIDDCIAFHNRMNEANK